MNLSEHIAQNLHDIYFGPNWATSTYVRKLLEEISMEQAVQQPQGFNSLALLTFHLNYYVCIPKDVLQGKPLDAHDKYSFSMEVLQSEEQWQTLQKTLWTNVEALTNLVKNLPEKELWEDFDNGKYGTVYRSLQGLTDHSNYHLGQLSLVRKLILK